MIAAVARADGLGHRAGVDQAGAPVDVDAHGRRARVHHGERSCDERVRGDDHLVARCRRPPLGA